MKTNIITVIATVTLATSALCAAAQRQSARPQPEATMQVRDLKPLVGFVDEAVAAQTTILANLMADQSNCVASMSAAAESVIQAINAHVANPSAETEAVA